MLLGKLSPGVLLPLWKVEVDRLTLPRFLLKTRTVSARALFPPEDFRRHALSRSERFLDRDSEEDSSVF